MNYPTAVSGQHFNIPFPTSVEHLLDQGPNFLTQALRANNVISADNYVSEITSSKEFFGGGMGRKLILNIAYAIPSDTLHTQLFIKFPREFGDPLREVFSAVLEPEIRFALLSRNADFPIGVPQCYFADFDSHTGSSILITEAIAFAQGNIEKAHDKCLDYELDKPLEHYQALVCSVAKLAAAHKAGQLGGDINTQFPVGEADKAATIPYTRVQLADKLSALKTFSEKHPQMFPANLLADNFVAQFIQSAPLVLNKQQQIKDQLNANSDYMAICHWNANIDNAWFYRDNNDALHAGLLDWGSVGQMNVAQAFFGLICAAETDFLNAHKTELIELFIQQYHQHGGPQLALAEFTLNLQLSVALLGIAWMIDSPAIVEMEVGDVSKIKDRFDPLLRNNFLGRAQLQLLTVFLNEWKMDNLSAVIRSL